LKGYKEERWSWLLREERVMELGTKQKRIYEVGYAFLLIYAIAAHISTGLASIATAGGALAILALLIVNKGHVDLTDRQIILSKAFFIFCILVGFTNFFSHNPMDSLWGMVGMVVRFTPMFMAIFFLKSDKQVLWIIVALFISVVIADFATIKQLLNYEQPIGFVHNRIYFANQLLPMLILGVACIFYKKYTFKVRCFIGIAMLLTAGVLIFSQVRGVWLAALATYLLFLLAYRKRDNKLAILSCAFALVVTLCFWLNPELLARLQSIGDIASASNIERIYMWQSAWRMFIEYPLVGLGYGQFQQFYTTDYHYLMPLSKYPGFPHPHNVVMTFLAETGLIGVIGFFTLFGTILLITWRRFCETRDRLAIVAFLSTAGFLFAGMTDHVFAMLTVFRMISLLIGMGFSKATLESN